MPSGLFIKTITLILLYLLKKKKEMLYFKKSRAGKKKNCKQWESAHKLKHGRGIQDRMSTRLRLS